MPVLYPRLVDTTETAFHVISVCSYKASLASVGFNRSYSRSSRWIYVAHSIRWGTCYVWTGTHSILWSDWAAKILAISCHRKRAHVTHTYFAGYCTTLWLVTLSKTSMLRTLAGRHTKIKTNKQGKLRQVKLKNWRDQLNQAHTHTHTRTTTLHHRFSIHCLTKTPPVKEEWSEVSCQHEH